jgi:hypothetical protein
MSQDHPSNTPCNAADAELWQQFVGCYHEQFGSYPTQSELYTEAYCAQFVDQTMPKYHELVLDLAYRRQAQTEMDQWHVAAFLYRTMGNEFLENTQNWFTDFSKIDPNHAPEPEHITDQDRRALSDLKSLVLYLTLARSDEHGEWAQRVMDMLNANEEFELYRAVESFEYMHRISSSVKRVCRGDGALPVGAKYTQDQVTLYSKSWHSDHALWQYEGLISACRIKFSWHQDIKTDDTCEFTVHVVGYDADDHSNTVRIFS